MRVSGKLIIFSGLVLWAAFISAAERPVVEPTVAGNPYDSGIAPIPLNEIDKLVFAKLQKLGIKPANVCTDAVFIRRAYLDAIGVLPTAREVQAFLKDANPEKRELLIDQLLKREEFADYWTMKWCDILRVKAEFPINLWPNAVQAYHRWIQTAIRRNMPYDQFARELLTSNGSNFRVYGRPRR